MTPIYLTDEEAAKDFDEIVESIRFDLTKLRGKIYDVEQLFPAWKERVTMADGGLTCVIMALYDTVEEYKEIKSRRNKN